MAADVRTLVQTMARANPRWGAPALVFRDGRLTDLEAQFRQFVVNPRRMPASLANLAHVLTNHIGQIVAADCFVVPTATYRLLFVSVFLAHDRRGIRHIAVTAHPTAAWTPHGGHGEGDRD